MIAAKGSAVTLTLEDGRVLRPDASAALLHDEDGAAWPKCSALVMRIRKTGQALPEDAVPSSTRRYFGKDYVVRRAEVHLPPAALEGWTRVGPAVRIDYSRRGEYADDYWHPFGESGLLWKAPLPIVYRRGAALRIELGSGCVWNWRGIVTP